MKQLIEQFSNQLLQAINIGKKSKLNVHGKTYNQVFVSGLGGSGIGATMVQEYVNDKLAIPFVVNKDYAIAKSVNASTLFIACSYSGNTEETLAAVAEAIKRKATIVCVTSGGELEVFANKNKCDLILIPSGMPPRACLGYSLTQLLFILKKAKLLGENFEKQFLIAATNIEKNTKAIQKEAKAISQKLFNRRIAMYTLAGSEGLAVRFRQQLNENSKLLSWHNVIPEMTHNEIVGWKKLQPDLTVVFIYSNDDNPKNLKRMKVMKDVVKKYKAKSLDIELKGENYWDKVFNYIHLTDWVSIELAEKNEEDASEIKIINFLKAYMLEK